MTKVGKHIVDSPAIFIPLCMLKLSLALIDQFFMCTTALSFDMPGIMIVGPADRLFDIGNSIPHS